MESKNRGEKTDLKKGEGGGADTTRGVCKNGELGLGREGGREKPKGQPHDTGEEGANLIINNNKLLGIKKIYIVRAGKKG